MLRRFTLIKILGVLVLAGFTINTPMVSAAFAQQESPYEKIVADLLGSVEEMSKHLSSIKDADSAKSAIAPLTAAAKKFVAIRKQADDLPEQPDLAERSRIVEKYQKKFADAFQKFQAELRRVRGVEGGQETLKALSILEPPKKTKKNENPKKSG